MGGTLGQVHFSLLVLTAATKERPVTICYMISERVHSTAQAASAALPVLGGAVRMPRPGISALSIERGAFGAETSDVETSF